MAGPHAIESALDLMRMPNLALSSTPRPLPADILVLIRIAAGSPEACEEARLHTGIPVSKLQEAASFYLQHALFRPDADAYRVLGLSSGASRELAHRHFKWLLQWLHPDKNRGVESIYSQRVLTAWREISQENPDRTHTAPDQKRRPRRVDVRLRREAILLTAKRYDGGKGRNANIKFRRVIFIAVAALVGTVAFVAYSQDAARWLQGVGQFAPAPDVSEAK